MPVRDISLISRTGTENRKITSTAEKLSITLTIPDKLKPNSETDRTFAVIRVHDGKAEVLNDMDNDDNTITIETDCFSTYALCYKDTPKTVQEPSSKPAQTPSSGSTDKEGVQTGDDNLLRLFAILAIISGGGYMLLYFSYIDRMTDKKNI